MRTRILFEDEEVMVVYKPSGLATQTAKLGQIDVVSELRNYENLLRKREGKQVPPFVGIVHRLDQPVEGLLVFGKTSKATASLNAQLQDKTLEKRYHAVICGKPEESKGHLVDYLVKDSNGRAQIVKPETPDGKKAVLDYRLLGTTNVQIGANLEKEEASQKQIPLSLVEVKLSTGRFHQIRAQMSHMGCPLLGDTKYGNELSLVLTGSLGVETVALCASRLEFSHPSKNKKMEYTVSPENKAFALFENFFS